MPCLIDCCRFEGLRRAERGVKALLPKADKAFEAVERVERTLAPLLEKAAAAEDAAAKSQARLQVRFQVHVG